MGKKDLYNYFTAAGLTHAGTLGLLGNLQAESGCEACRLQGDYDLTRSRSKAYAEKVDSGEMSVHIFSRDAQGWGLAQWTYWSRKEALYYFCRGRGKSIADEMCQAQFIVKELRDDYPQLLKYLSSTDEMFTATKRVCEEYERPAINNVQARYAMAKSIEAELAASPADETKPTKETYWPPRTIDARCSKWPEVWLLQAALKCHGYNTEHDGVFNESLSNKVKEFQTKSGLDADGAVGPMTWKKLLNTREN